MKKGLFVTLMLFVALAAVFGMGLIRKQRDVASPFIGMPAPPFKLAQLHEPARSMGVADMRGQVWLLNVWASWCAPCREEHPLLVTMAREQGVPIVGVNYKDDPRNAQEWLIRLGDPYKVSVVDPDGHVTSEYGVFGVPETFVIDRAGVVRFKHVGPLTREIWMRKVRPLLLRLQG